MCFWRMTGSLSRTKGAEDLAFTSCGTQQFRLALGIGRDANRGSVAHGLFLRASIPVLSDGKA